MSDLFKTIQVPIDPDELDLPFTVHTTDGTLASLGDMIDRYHPAFRRELGLDGARPHRTEIARIADLDQRQLGQVAIMFLKKSDDRELLEIGGGSVHSRADLLLAIERQLPIGKKFVRDLRAHGMLLEDALREGRVVRANRRAMTAGDLEELLEQYNRR